MHGLCAFSITTPLNASGLHKERPEHCMVLKSHLQGSDYDFVPAKIVLWRSLLTLISTAQS